MAKSDFLSKQEIDNFSNHSKEGNYTAIVNSQDKQLVVNISKGQFAKRYEYDMSEVKKMRKQYDDWTAFLCEGYLKAINGFG